VPGHDGRIDGTLPQVVQAVQLLFLDLWEETKNHPVDGISYSFTWIYIYIYIHHIYTIYIYICIHHIKIPNMEVLQSIPCIGWNMFEDVMYLKPTR